MKQQITIIDYGVGNLRSLVRSFEHFGANVSISEDVKTITESAGIVLPGDGAFGAGMEGLRIRGLTEVVRQFARAGKPILGICLGAQILLSEGYEFGKCAGLSIIGGRVIKFPELADSEKIPQIGWNSIYPPKGKSWQKTILRGVTINSSVYFIHSYIIEPDDQKDILALSTYGGHQFCSAVCKGNIFGCQFHPEKSGDVGLAIIKNFIDYV